MKCPGQDTQFWKPGAIYETPCPKCGHAVEFFKDDTTRKCGQCGHRFLNPEMDFGCASYCEFAEQCLGDLPPELLAQKEDLLKDRVAVAMKRHYHRDFKRIGHAMRVARYAERIGKQERGNLAVILPAAYLHGIGMHNGDGGLAQQDMPAEALTKSAEIARTILKDLGAREALIDEVCEIIGRNLASPADASLNCRIVHDAVQIARLAATRSEAGSRGDEKISAGLDMLLTGSGLEEARALVGNGRDDDLKEKT